MTEITDITTLLDLELILQGAGCRLVKMEASRTNGYYATVRCIPAHDPSDGAPTEGTGVGVTIAEAITDALYVLACRVEAVKLAAKLAAKEQ